MKLLKTTFKALIVLGSVFLMISCRHSTDEQKIAKATADLKEFAQDLTDEMATDAKNDLNEVVDSIKDAEFDGDVEMRKEWLDFKSAAFVKFESNDKAISEYIENHSMADSQIQMRISDKARSLTKKNDELKAKLNNYIIHNKTDWEKFKGEFNHDRDELDSVFQASNTVNK